MVQISSFWISIYLLATNPSRRSGKNIPRKEGAAVNKERHQYDSIKPIQRTTSTSTSSTSSSGGSTTGAAGRQSSGSIKRSNKDYAISDGNNSKRTPASSATQENRRHKGRKRFTRQGTKTIRARAAGGGTNDRGNNLGQLKQDVQPLPPLPMPDSPRPFYYTCRHTYEEALMEEIQKYAMRVEEQTQNDSVGRLTVSSPYPGLVRVEQQNHQERGHQDLLSEYFDPIYALQTMPNAVVVSAASIKGLAKEIMLALLGICDDGNNVDLDHVSTLQRNQLRSACRGSLVVHTIVPGCCKGQPAPTMKYRCDKVGEELIKMLRKIFPAARNPAVDENHGNDIVKPPPPPTVATERWLLQVMLQSNTLAVASLTRCKHIGPGHQAYWPNYRMPLGLAKVDIEEKMPSSAYRKLMEALECMAIAPSSSAFVVDLGASPGGWTAVMRRLGCFVVAVDRSEIDPKLMADECVSFVKGDAFTYSPTLLQERSGKKRECWMISDVIAYPDRVTKLLRKWCHMDWASYLVVTMKFQGDSPALDEVERARDIVKSQGYDCRVKHFFNNKNEVTFMISRTKDTARNFTPGVVGVPMYPLCS
jgi:Predicted SAM-dependent methyltransferase